MSIAVAVKKFSGREYVYIYENYRDPTTRRPTSRVLKSFGRKDKLLAENPNAMALIEEQAQKLSANSDTYQQTLEQRLGAGVHMAPTSRDKRPKGLSCTPAPYFRLWNTLGMSDYFTNYRRNHKIAYDLNQAVFLACLGRIVAPASKRRTWMNRNRYLFDFGELRLADVYNSLGVLAERKEYIIRKLNESIGKMYHRDLAIALYDVTTFYFESFTEDELRRRGMSKEHRTQETQVVLGLLVDSEGVPITYELFPGNTAEVGTLLKVVDEFRRQYNIESVTVIADSGLNQTLNLEALEAYGFKYIVGYPPYVKLTKKEQARILDSDGWVNTMDGDDIAWRVKDLSMTLEKRLVDPETGRSRPVTLEARCIATYSRKRYIHDIDELEKKWRKAKELVQRGPAAVKAAGRSGFKAFINVEPSGVSVKEDLYDKRKKWAGYMALLTNIKSENPEAIYSKLRQLWRIEENFRILKTDLQARPVFVWTQEHIRGHFLMSYIALVMQRILQRLLLNSGLQLSTEEIVRALDSVRVNRVVGMGKGKGMLFSCVGNNEVAATVKDEAGEPLSLSELFDRIFRVCDLEPLLALESEESLRRKLKIKLPLSALATDKIR